jgi:hypothetical protein
VQGELQGSCMGRSRSSGLWRRGTLVGAEQLDATPRQRSRAWLRAWEAQAQRSADSSSNAAKRGDAVRGALGQEVSVGGYVAAHEPRWHDHNGEASGYNERHGTYARVVGVTYGEARIENRERDGATFFTLE